MSIEQFWAALAGAASAILVMGTIYAVVIRRNLDGFIVSSLQRQPREFHPMVFEALAAEPAKHKAEVEKVLAIELAERRQLHTTLIGVEAQVSHLTRAFDEYRAVQDGRMDLLITIPKTVMDLDATLKALNRLIERQMEVSTDLAQRISHMEGINQIRRRSS